MFFTILAIIGKILLTILKILLFLFLFVLFVGGLVLFVPVCYRLSGIYYANDKRAEGSLSWLGSAVAVKFKYDHNTNESLYVLKIFGIKILPRKEKTCKSRKNKSDTNVNVRSGAVKNVRTKEKTDKKKTDDIRKKTEQKNKIQDIKENRSEIKKFSLKDKENDGKSADAETEENIGADKIKKSVLENILTKIKNIPQSISNIFNKITGMIKKAADTIKKMYGAAISGKEKAVLVKDFIFGYESRNMICFVKDNMLHLWRYIKPRYFRTEITLGFDDPALTGQVLGAAAAFCGALGIMPCITPDFEKQIFEGETEVKGRIMIFVLIRLLIKIYISEEIKDFKKSYESIREVL